MTCIDKLSSVSNVYQTKLNMSFNLGKISNSRDDSINFDLVYNAEQNTLE